MGKPVMEMMRIEDLQIKVAGLKDEVTWWRDEAVQLQDRLAKAKAKMTMQKGPLPEAEGKATILRGSLAEALEKASLSKHRASRAAAKAMEAFRKERTSAKSYWNPAKTPMLRALSGAKGKWQSTIPILTSTCYLRKYHLLADSIMAKQCCQPPNFFLYL